MNVHIQHKAARFTSILPLIALGLLSGLGATAQSPSHTYYASTPPAVACAAGTATTQSASATLLRTCYDALEGRSLSRADRAATLVNTGILEMRLGDTSEALDLFARAEELDPALPDIRINVAAAQIRAGQADAALETLAEPDSVAPGQRHIAWFNRGLAHWHVEDFDSAYRDFKQAALLRPDYEAALNMLDLFSVEPAVQAGGNSPARSG